MQYNSIHFFSHHFCFYGFKQNLIALEKKKFLDTERMLHNIALLQTYITLSGNYNCNYNRVSWTNTTAIFSVRIYKNDVAIKFKLSDFHTIYLHHCKNYGTDFVDIIRFNPLIKIFQIFLCWLEEPRARWVVRCFVWRFQEDVRFLYIVTVNVNGVYH